MWTSAACQKPGSKIHLLYCNLFAPLVKGLFLFDSGDDAAAAVGQAGVGIAFSQKTESALLD